MIPEISLGEELNLTAKNVDCTIMDLIRFYRQEYPDVHEYNHRLEERITCVSVSALRTGWIMYVNVMG